MRGKSMLVGDREAQTHTASLSELADCSSSLVIIIARDMQDTWRQLDRSFFPPRIVFF